MAEAENIFQMYVKNGCQPGFWVRRDSWTDTVARIEEVGPLNHAEAPYYGNPKVRASFWSLSTGECRNEGKLSCPGNYSYTRVDPPGGITSPPSSPRTPPATAAARPDRTVRTMPQDRITKFLDLIEGAGPEELAEIVHEALEAMPDDQQALAACGDWAETTMQLEDLLFELTDRMATEAEAGPS